VRSLSWYMSLPWTIRTEIRKDKGTYYVIRVNELPGLLVTGRSDQEVEKNFWEALESHLLSYLNENEEPPVPDIIKERLKIEPSLTVRETGQLTELRSESRPILSEVRVPVHA